MSLRSSLLKDTAIVFLANAASALIGFATLVLVTRTMSPAAFGAAAPLLTLLDMGQVLIEAVVGAGVVQVAMRHRAGDPVRSRMALGVGLRARVGIALSLAVLAAAAAGPVSALLFDTEARRWQIVAIGACLVALAINSSTQAMLQVEQAFLRLAANILLKNLTRLAMLVPVIVLYGLSTDGFVAAVVAGCGLCGVLSIALVPRALQLSPVPDRAVAREVFDVNKWMLVVALAYVGGRVDTIMLSALSNDTEVAWYASALQLCIGVTMLSQALGTTLFPKVAGLAGAEAMRSHLRRWIRGVPLAAAAILAIAAVGPLVVPMLLGPGYDGTAGVFAVLVVSAGLTLISNPVLMMLFPLGEVRVLAFVTVAQLVLRVAMNLVLMPAYGAMGAGVADVVSKAVTLAVACVLIVGMVRRVAPAAIPEKADG